MAVPKKRTAPARRDKRRSQNSKLDPVNLAKCKSCGEYMMPHKVCKKCGNYDGKPIVAEQAK